MLRRSPLALFVLLALPLPVRPAEPPAKSAAVAPAPPAPAPEAEASPKVRLAVPIFGEEFATLPVARVEGEVVMLEELASAIEEAHRGGRQEGAGKRDYGKMLDRLVNVRLVVAEARAMGLDETSEAKEGMEAGRDRLKIRMLQERATAGAVADPKEVERLFRLAAREWKLRSVLFKTEAEAKQLVAAVSGGKPFLAAVEQAVKEKRAEQTEPGDFVKPSALTPQVAGAIAVLAKGQATPPLKVGQVGWSIVRLEDVRYPEDPKARAEAEQQARAAGRLEALKKAYAEMEKRFLVKNEALLKSINFDKPAGGPEALEKDGRVLVKVKGGKDITVGELAKDIHGRLYHGVSEAQKAKQIDKSKFAALESMTSRRVLPLEATRVGIPTSAEYRKAARDFEISYLFGAFVQKVVAPELTVKPEEIQAWYDAHQADYMYPAFYRLDVLGFEKLELAQAAAVKLRQGTDYAWLKANAEGLIPAGQATLAADGAAVLSAKALPEGLAKALDGARAGDTRVYTASEAQHYMVVTRDVVAPRPRPIDEARGEIQDKLYGQALTRSMDDWFTKLRAARKVEILLER